MDSAQAAEIVELLRHSNQLLTFIAGTFTAWVICFALSRSLF